MEKKTVETKNRLISPDFQDAAAAAKVLQLCLTLCDPIDGSPPVHGIFQARTLEWVAIASSGPHLYLKLNLICLHPLF